MHSPATTVTTIRTLASRSRLSSSSGSIWITRAALPSPDREYAGAARNPRRTTEPGRRDGPDGSALAHRRRTGWSVGDDRELDVRGDRVMQSHADRVAPDVLDRLGDLDRALVHRRAAGLLDGPSDVVGRDGAEQLAGRTGPDGQRDAERLEFRADLL